MSLARSNFLWQITHVIRLGSFYSLNHLLIFHHVTKGYEFEHTGNILIWLFNSSCWFRYIRRFNATSLSTFLHRVELIRIALNSISSTQILITNELIRFENYLAATVEEQKTFFLFSVVIELF